jgi:hypothetical protein
MPMIRWPSSFKSRARRPSPHPISSVCRPRRRHETKKLVAVKQPTTVVSGSARPLNPLAGLSLPPDTWMHEAMTAIAGTLDLTIPPTLLARAGQVIE